MIPLLVLGFLLAGTLLAASAAGSAALVAHRRLAADCDGAALAGATALDRAEGGKRRWRRGSAARRRCGGPDRRGLSRCRRARHPARTSTPAGTVTVVCRRTVRVPFGAIIARPHGIRETATARAPTVLRPST